MHDVLVIGAGPAGCHAAAHLAEAGLDVLVIEEHREIGRPMDCSGILGVEAFERFSLPREAIVGELQNAILVSPAGLEIEFNLNHPVAYVLDRTRFDQSLASLAMSHGANFQLSSRVKDLELKPDGVEASIDEDGWTRLVCARTAVLAAGVHYGLQSRIGMGLPAELLVTAQAEVPVESSKAVEVYFGEKLGRGAFAWYVPFLRDGHTMARIGLLTEGKGVGRLRQFFKQKGIANRLKVDNPSIRGSVIPIRPLARTSLSRIVAVGDAAGLAKPTTGGGIYYGLISASLAAEVITKAFRDGDFSEPRFASYDRAWRRELGRELFVDRMFRRLTSGLADEEVDRIFSLASANGLMPRLTRRLRFDWHRDAILTLLRHPGIGLTFLRAILW